MRQQDQVDGYFRSPVNNQSGVVNYSSYSVSTHYVNTTSMAVYIKDRSGIVTEIVPNRQPIITPSYPRGCLVIHQVHKADRGIVDSWLNQLSVTDPSLRTEAMVQRANIEDTDNHNYNQTWMVPTMTSYKVALQGANFKAIIKYVKDFDIMVMAGVTMDEAIRVTHPFSMVGEIEYACTRQAVEKNLFIKVVYNCKDRQADSLWTVLCNSFILPVEPTYDPRLGEGIYVYYPGTLAKSRASHQGDYFDSLEKANSRTGETGLEFFTMRAEAEVRLSESAERVAELKISEFKAKAESIQNALLRATKEKEAIERKAEQDRQSHQNELERLKLERENAKVEQEAKEREYRRKNTHEMFKYVPVIVTAITTMLALAVKLMPAK